MNLAMAGESQQSLGYGQRFTAFYFLKACGAFIVKVPNLVRVDMFRVVLLTAILLLVAWPTTLIVRAFEPPQSENLKTEDTSSKQLGSIVGLITYEGEVPQTRIADDTGHRHDLLTVDRKTRGLKYAIAYLDSGSSADGVNQNMDVPHEPVTIDQKEHVFVPHLLAIRSGQSVTFTNSDTANHNVRSTTLLEKNQFNVITEAGRGYKHQFFSEHKVRPVLLTCDIHPWMNAWIYVFDHPYYSVTDLRGRFEITAIEPGDHRLIIRQPDGGFHKELKVEIKAGRASKVEIRVRREDLKDF